MTLCDSIFNFELYERCEIETHIELNNKNFVVFIIIIIILKVTCTTIYVFLEFPSEKVFVRKRDE